MKPIIELTPQQIDRAIEGLPIEEKLKLTEKLEKQTLSLRWRQILRAIDARLKKSPLSQREALEEIKAYRQEKRNAH